MAKQRFMDRFFNFLGYEEDDEEYEMDRFSNREEEHSPLSVNKKSGTVLSLHSQKSMKVIVVEPGVFEESQGIVEHLKNHRQVILNLENTDKDLAKRVIDFISGATYALDGTVQKISAGVFLFAPSNVDVTSEMKEDLKERNLLWASLIRGDKK